MALSLKDVKKAVPKAQPPKKKFTPTEPEPIQVEVQSETQQRPWHSHTAHQQTEVEDESQAHKDLGQRITDWVLSIELQPKLKIPIPSFLIYKEKGRLHRN